MNSPTALTISAIGVDFGRGKGFSREYPLSFAEAYAPLTKGDRVRVKDGYDGAGEVYWYVGKSTDDADRVNVEDGGKFHAGGGWLCTDIEILAAAIEPYPYSREERIERAIEDFNALLNLDPHDSMIAALFAILDAGI